MFLSAFAEDHGLCPWMNADSAVRSFVCRWANATADSATGGYPAEALGLRTGRFHRRWAQAGISWRYHGLCPWGSIKILLMLFIGLLVMPFAGPPAYSLVKFALNIIDHQKNQKGGEKL